MSKARERAWRRYENQLTWPRERQARLAAARSRDEEQDTQLYLVGSLDVRPVKIGVSRDPYTRLADMQTGSPVLLRLLWTAPGGYDEEFTLHQHFRWYRKHGEWFDFGAEHPDPVALVASVAARLSSPADREDLAANPYRLELSTAPLPPPPPPPRQPSPGAPPPPPPWSPPPSSRETTT